MKDEYIERVKKAIDNAINNVTKLTDGVFNIPGMSTRENRILLNELLRDGDKYLEIGVYKGSTFASAMHNNNVTGVAIDNFCNFGGQDNKQWFDQACRENNVTNFAFINNDCFNLTDDQKEIAKGANVYFYDGEHEHIDQERALTYYIDLLPDTFIFVVDDWNYGPAKTGTRAGLEICKVKIHQEWELDRNTSHLGWHNGLYIAVLEKQKN